jgi:hypothetical protein
MDSLWERDHKRCEGEKRSYRQINFSTKRTGKMAHSENDSENNGMEPRKN